jgi:hypothetical protein
LQVRDLFPLYHKQWDGKSSKGNRLEAGTYFLQVTNGTTRLSGKLLLMN